MANPASPLSPASARQLPKPLQHRLLREIFQPDIARIPRFPDRMENIGIVQLSRVQLMPAGAPRRVEMAYPGDILPDIPDEVALRDLLVVDVEQHLHPVAPHFLYDLKGLRRGGQIISLMIHSRVQGLQQQSDIRSLQKLCRPLCALAQSLVLLLPRPPRIRSHLADQPAAPPAA